MKNLSKIALVVSLTLSGAAFAAGPNAQEAVQRDVNQQQRVEQGLKSGALTTKEAGKIEKDEAKINRQEARDLKDGKISASEQAKLSAEQNKVSKEIYTDKHNAAVGNPTSKSSERMQADVQRNVNQEKRIEQGAKSGSLTNKEVGSLERGQARVDQKEANAAKDGHVGAAEQRSIQGSENHQSKRIFNKKHNAVKSK